MPRFHRSGRDPILTPPQTTWQRERQRGRIEPMEQPRRSWFRFGRAG